MATPKQQKLINLLSENIGKTGKRKSLGSLMLEAGYSDVQSKNPAPIIGSDVVQEGIAPFLKQLDDKRRMAITHMTEKKLKNAPARELAYVSETLTKQHQLLSGGDTERVTVNAVEITVQK